MATLSREQARAVVDDIRVINGGLPEEVRSSLPEEVLRSIRNLQSMAGGSIRHVAHDLYDQDTRFIFELIQNAEDNHYGSAADQGEDPFLHFTLHQNRMTVDMNEDGFNENDVRAICSIHNSSKLQTGGYIGHKGIGFKSVFKIADRVRIQSGPFCFSFEHRQGESGLGMITPFNQPEGFEHLPPGVRTRITLFLIQDEDFVARAGELREIPDTLLLFLRKLHRLDIEIVPESFRVSFRRQEDEPNRSITLTKETNDATTEERIYHVQKRILSGLPEHENRPRQTTAEVILAFPVDDTFAPVIEPQYVYSFLPMRREGFNFLIQSDFITPANRQGVHQCARNDTIRECISDLFVEAVLYFCNHGTMKYEWLEYLPGLSVNDPFWTTLREMIFEKLKESRVLLTGGGVLSHPKALQHPSSRHCDQYGQPLLDDIAPEVYLSGSYNWSSHVDKLTELGVTNLSFKNILDRLDPYLSGPSPRFLNPILDDDWHTRIAELLLRALTMYGTTFKPRIERMAIIPTSRGYLLPASSGDIHFPMDEKADFVPGDLSLKLVDSTVVLNKSRRKLLEALGITWCPIPRVISAILQRYDVSHGVTLSNSIDHLKYLYHHLGREEALDKRVFVMNQQERPIYRAFVPFGASIIRDDLYFGTSGEYGTKMLAQKLQSRSEQQNDTPVEIHIIHDEVLTALPAHVRSHGRSWEWWLESIAGVRRVPRLKHHRGDGISSLFQCMTEYYPKTLVGVLKTYWSHYQKDLTPTIIKKLRTMAVPDRNTSLLQPLESLYYPSKQLLNICSRARILDSFPRFLEIPADIITETTDGWECLATFSVGLKPTLQFFDIIFHLLRSHEHPDAQKVAGFFEMYEELCSRFPFEAEAVKRQIFGANPAVCIPAVGQRATSVVELSKCVWVGDKCLTTCHSLALFSEYSGNPGIAFLFQRMLRLPDAGLDTYLSELKHRKDREQDHALCDVYNMISQKTTTRSENLVVGSTFRIHKLVYIPARSLWVDPESCVWSETPVIGGKFGISATYPQLGDLFQKVLNIQAPTTMTYIAQLRILIAEKTTNIVAVKAAIYGVNELWSSPSEIEDLRSMQFLPVEMQGARVTLLKPSDTFFISDRLEYQSIFRGRAPLLGFSLEESRKLYKLWRALGLEDRFLSRVVEERTVVEDPALEPSSRETRSFQRKVKHIYRCALHYNPEISETDNTALRHQLQHAAIYESDGFKKTLVLQLNDFTTTVECGNGTVHIETASDALRIYVPRNPQDRSKCYSLHLPGTLARFLGLKDGAASLTFHLVFLSDESILEDLLDGNGIIRGPAVDFPEPQPEPEFESDTASHTLSMGSVIGETRAGGVIDGLGVPHSPSETAVDTVSDVDSIEFEVTHRSRGSSHHPGASRSFTSHSHASSPRPRPITFPRLSLEPPGSQIERLHGVPEYVELLGNVIRLARQAVLPDAGQNPTNGADVGGVLTTGLPFGMRSESQLAHDIKIGAAGELFVFELLQTLNLPEFGGDNWRSTIRKEVIVHPDYRDLAPWTGAETADFVYYDATSALTTLLIQAGYLPERRWEGARPIYYMEVKTTTGQYDSPFYMSKGQYRRMQRMQIDLNDEVNEEIYMIFRVCHLNRESMGVKIYLDPETLRQDGGLIFTAESYSVLPAQT